MVAASPELAEFYAGCYDRLVRVMTLAAGSREAGEELVQDAFIRLIPRWSTISTYDDPEAWVRRVAFRLLSNRSRHLRTVFKVLPRLSAPAPAPPIIEGLAVDVARALARLPVNQREVVILHDLLDLPVDQIASDLGIPVGTVKSRLSRARTALAPLLREDTDHA
jgi:RNA polymerase sigma-70 factor (ECF subfamily)